MEISEIIANAHAELDNEDSDVAGNKEEVVEQKEEVSDNPEENKSEESKEEAPETDKSEDKTETDKKELSGEEEKAGYLRQQDYTKKTMALAEKRKAYEKMNADLESLGKDPKALVNYFKSQGMDILVNEKIEETQDVYQLDKEYASDEDIKNAENINKAFREQNDLIKQLKKENDSFNSHLTEQKNRSDYSEFENNFKKMREDYGLPEKSLGIVTAIFNEGQRQYGESYTLTSAMGDVAKVATGGLDLVNAVDKNPEITKKLKEKYVAEYLAKKEADKKDSSLPSNSSGSKQTPPKTVNKKRKTIEQVLQEGRNFFGIK